MTTSLLVGDCRNVLRSLPSESVHCVVTSPPYFGLRDYGVAGQIGLERTPDEYVAALVGVFRDVRRALRKDGTLWLNLGDSYASGNSGQTLGSHSGDIRNRIASTQTASTRSRPSLDSLKPKDLIGIPWRVAFALQQPYAIPTCVKSDIDRAWLAAIMDGEGCIGIRRFDSYGEEKQQVYQDGFVVYTVVTNNDVPILDRCIEITGHGKAALKQAAETTDGRGIVSRRDSYGWRLDGNKAVEIIQAAYPFLIAKRKQACIAYTLDQLNKGGHGSRAVPTEIQEKKALLWELVKKCNQRESVDLPGWVEEPKQEIQPGWYLRQDIIWSKPNPMPESVRDRCTKAHEYLFLLSKSERYYFDADAIREPISESTLDRWNGAPERKRPNGIPTQAFKPGEQFCGVNPNGRNKRSVWEIATQPYADAHFATFPPALIEPCIKAGTSAKGRCAKCGAPWVRDIEIGESSWAARKAAGHPTSGYHAADGAIASRDIPLPRNGKPNEGGLGWVAPKKTIGWSPSCSCNAAVVPCTVLDPFAGAGTTALVADRLQRNGMLIELNPDYAGMAESRIKGDAPLFADINPLMIEVPA